MQIKIDPFRPAATTVSFLLLCLCVTTMPASVLAQLADLSFLRTRAETSNFEETTRYDELVQFLEVATSQHPMLHLTSFGYTTEGRSLPLVVFGAVPDASPASVLASNKLRVYIQANIHAGEVCGKEALLQLIRSIAAGQHQPWADSLVVLIAPIYNADGNERISIYNRPRQNGPFGGMGQRPNAQDLDLNRDHMKARSPEARSLIRLMNEYDPHVFVDLHTTNGSRIAYHLTYAPPLNPNTDEGIDSLLRNDWLPSVTDEIKKKYDWDYYYYGNLPYRRASEPGWYTFDHRPRFNNNYVGLRNRVAILSEAYAYAPFRERILASRYFVEEILDYAHRNAGLVSQTVAAADSRSVVGDTLAVRARMQKSTEQVEILMGDVISIKNPYSGSTVFERTDTRTPVSMYEYGSFAASESTRVPSEYYVKPSAAAVLASLDIHGIRYETLTDDQTTEIETFVVDSTSVSERVFQGVQERVVYGNWELEPGTLEAGTIVIPMDQPLSRLAFYLLEPRSDDGLTNWAILDRMISVGAAYPILRSAN